jgi:hypothetical protein
MADYISCVEASGGNSERIAYDVTNANAGKTDVGVKGSGSGVVVKGSGSVTVDRATEQALASKFEHTWTVKGMEECRKALSPPKSSPPRTHKSQSGNCNINQIGGRGNQATANCGPATWKLDDKHFDNLALDFKRKARPSCVISAASDSDSQDLAKQLCRAVSGGGHSTCVGPGLGNYVSPLEDAATSGEVLGLGCYADSPENTSLVSIKDSLSEVDLGCEYRGKTFSVHGVSFCTGGDGRGSWQYAYKEKMTSHDKLDTAAHNQFIHAGAGPA